MVAHADLTRNWTAAVARALGAGRSAAERRGGPISAGNWQIRIVEPPVRIVP